MPNGRSASRGSAQEGLPKEGAVLHRGGGVPGGSLHPGGVPMREVGQTPPCDQNDTQV